MSWKDYIQDNLLTYITIIIVVLSWVATAHWQVLQPEYATMIGALLAALGVHKGSEIVYDRLVPPKDLHTEDTSGDPPDRS